MESNGADLARTRVTKGKAAVNLLLYTPLVAGSIALMLVCLGGYDWAGKQVPTLLEEIEDIGRRRRRRRRRPRRGD